MTIANADRCISNTLIYEGGFGRTRADRGDWTSGQIGVGRFGGTAYGIAAMTLKERGLPEDFDLSTLTRAQAVALYRKKEWLEVAGDAQPMGLDQIIYDGTVNSGRGRGVPWVGRAVGCSTPTNPTAVAVAATALSYEARREAVKVAVASRTAFLRGLAIYKTFGAGWMKRCTGMEAIGVKMVLEDSKAPAPVIKKELEKEAGAAGTTSTRAGTGAAGSAAGTGGGATQLPGVHEMDWTQLAGYGALALAAIFIVGLLVFISYKHFHRKNAYLAAADGTIGG